MNDGKEEVNVPRKLIMKQMAKTNGKAAYNISELKEESQRVGG